PRRVGEHGRTALFTGSPHEGSDAFPWLGAPRRRAGSERRWQVARLPAASCRHVPPGPRFRGCGAARRPAVSLHGNPGRLDARLRRGPRLGTGARRAPGGALMATREPGIGIFDSGIGGLTVVHRMAEALPHEHLLYLGDTARWPYGSKSAEVVTRYTLEN